MKHTIYRRKIVCDSCRNQRACSLVRCRRKHQRSDPERYAMLCASCERLHVVTYRAESYSTFVLEP